MFFTISQYTLISFILIISVHYIYLYLKDNLTIPKTKDLVEKPKKQYDEIYNTINKKHESVEKTETVKQMEMKNELKDYLKSLSRNKPTDKPGFSNQMSSSNFSSSSTPSYSAY